MNITVKKNTVIINGLSIEFDTLARVNSFLLDYIDVHGASGKVEEIKVENYTPNKVLDSLICEYGDIEIENLDLSVRAFNNLKRAGINHVQDILRLDYIEVVRIRNMGFRSVREIEEVVNRFIRHNFITWSERIITVEN